MERIEAYEYRPATPAIMHAFMMTMLAGALCVGIDFFVLPPTAWQMDMNVPVNGLNLWSMIRSEGMQVALSQHDLWRELLPRCAACVMSVCGAALIAYRARMCITPIVDGRKHYAGNQLLRGKSALAEINGTDKRERRKKECSIMIAPGAWLARMREVRNILICGAVGSGKTRLILFLIQQLLSRLSYDPTGDHAIFIHDTTGEIYEGLPLPDTDFAALHPHRPGGYAWQMGADLIEDSDCETAANQAIASTDQAIWGTGGATLYAGCMIVAKAENGAAWGASELYDVCLRDPVQLRQQFEQYYPAAAKLIEIDSNGELSKTTIGFLLTFRASILRSLRPLAHAWRNIPSERQFSFAAWVQGTKPEQPRVVVVQRSGRHPDISASWIGMVMETITTAVGDPQFQNSRTRSSCFVLDEAPALGRLRRWDELLDVGRNKGISTFAAIQDMAQFKRIYRDHADSIFQRFATKIICAQTHGPEAQALAEKEIGTREIVDRDITIMAERGPAGKTERTTTDNRRREVLIVRPEHLALRLGIFDGRVRALVTGFGNILELEWPMTTWKKRR